ncbi:MAG: precorrin-6A synthase (deacetylating) [Paracoccaceae bacterium]
MIELFLIGIGTGNPDHLTLQAIKALNVVDLVLIPRKGPDKSDLAELRRTICAEVLTNPATRIVDFDLPVRDTENQDYRSGVDSWHTAIAQTWARVIGENLGQMGRVALLVWGDPSLYDSTLRIAALVGATLPLQVTVIPGITSIQALAAAHAMPLNTIGGPVLITTGRQLRDHGWPSGAETLVVMLDGSCAFQAIDQTGISILWGAYVGMTEQIIRAGLLKDVGAEIVDARAKARAEHGWIMDIYILRRIAAATP